MYDHICGIRLPPQLAPKWLLPVRPVRAEWRRCRPCRPSLDLLLPRILRSFFTSVIDFSPLRISSSPTCAATPPTRKHGRQPRCRQVAVIHRSQRWSRVSRMIRTRCRRQSTTLVYLWWWIVRLLPSAHLATFVPLPFGGVDLRVVHISPAHWPWVMLWPISGSRCSLPSLRLFDLLCTNKWHFQGITLFKQVLKN